MKPFMRNIIVKHTNFPFFLVMKILDAVEFLVFFFPFLDKSCMLIHNFISPSQFIKSHIRCKTQEFEGF